MHLFKCNKIFKRFFKFLILKSNFSSKNKTFCEIHQVLLYNLKVRKKKDKKTRRSKNGVVKFSEKYFLHI